MRAELEGFAPFVRESQVVGISAFLLTDVTLDVGGIEETVMVTAEAPLIENGTASVASTIDRRQIEVLPSPGRNVFILAVTTPNVVHTGNPVWVKQSDQTNSLAALARRRSTPRQQLYDRRRFNNRSAKPFGHHSSV